MSFIIPCRNEEQLIEGTIKRIVSECKKNNINFEIIVVDNLSSDNSRQRVFDLGLKVHASESDSVAGVRNEGFKNSTGEILVFLDSDIYLAEGWGKVFGNVIEGLYSRKDFITGSHCSVPEGLRQPFRAWYKGIEMDTRDTHLGTGHMIMHKDLFVNLGMFNDNLKSGEDFDFCQRVARNGGSIVNNTDLVAYHMGYPENTLNFLKRESWHGVSDIKDWSSFLKSKVAIVSFLFLILNISFLVSLFSSFKSLAIFSSISLIILLIFVVFKKFSVAGPTDLVFKLASCYLYFFGRSLSIIRKFFDQRGSNE